MLLGQKGLSGIEGFETRLAKGRESRTDIEWGLGGLTEQRVRQPWPGSHLQPQASA
jgi:hypothetical protein